jgi:nucleoside-diphosphate kinase
MVVEGENAVTAMRQLMGKTNPANAEAGSIRADYSQEMSYNSIHGSDSPESAEREIAIYFKPEEICNWTTMFEILKAKLEG